MMRHEVRTWDTEEELRDEVTDDILAIEADGRSAGAAPIDVGSYREALRDVLAEFDYWVSEPRPAIDGGTVRIHNFGEVQPSMERALDAARRLLDATPFIERRESDDRIR